MTTSHAISSATPAPPSGGSSAARPPLSGQSSPPPPRWASRWAWAPAAVLVTLIGAQVSVLAAVLDDPTFSTEPDYYRKAVDWDAHMARTRESAALGWTVRARVEPAASDRGGEPSLSVVLSDQRGEPVAGARMQALAIFNARAARPLALALAEVAPGRYRAALGSYHAGLWELRLTAERAAERYETRLRLDLAAEAR
jgi:nitrogen fixation protein FixH